MGQLARLDFSRLVAMGRTLVIRRCQNPGEHRSLGGESCRRARHSSIVARKGPVVGILSLAFQPSRYRACVRSGFLTTAALDIVRPSLRTWHGLGCPRSLRNPAALQSTAGFIFFPRIIDASYMTPSWHTAQPIM
eukprot:1310266-Pyramimonas_sp.AAC.1